MSATNSTNHIPHLPDELTVMICRHLVSPESRCVGTLRKLRLASRGFAGIGAEALFETLKVSPGAVHREEIILASPPRYASTVRQLHLDLVDLGPKAGTLGLKNAKEMEDFSQQIQNLTKKHPNLRRLSIVICDSARRFIEQIKLPPTIEELQLCYDGEDFYFLEKESLPADLTALRKLSIRAVSSAAAALVSFHGRRVPALEHLELENIHTGYMWAPAPKCSAFIGGAPGLKTLKMKDADIWNEDYDDLFRSLSGMSSLAELTLESIMIEYTGRVTPIPALINVVQLPSLRILTLEKLGDFAPKHLVALISGSQASLREVTLWRLEFDTSDPAEILAIFDRLMECPQLKRIRLGFLEFPGIDRYIGPERPVAMRRWRRLLRADGRETRDREDQMKLKLLVAMTNKPEIHHKIGELVRHMHARGGSLGQDDAGSTTRVLPFLIDYYGGLYPVKDLQAGRATTDDVYPWDPKNGLRVEELVDREHEA